MEKKEAEFWRCLYYRQICPYCKDLTKHNVHIHAENYCVTSLWEQGMFVNELHKFDHQNDEPEHIKNRIIARMNNILNKVCSMDIFIDKTSEKLW